MMTWIKNTYQLIVDHLTKTLGAVGAGLMSYFAWVDPGAIHAAAQTYLGEKYTAKIGVFLFILVIVRGWYTGNKSK